MANHHLESWNQLVVINLKTNGKMRNVLSELQRLRKNRSIRIADAVIIEKDRVGEISYVHANYLPHDEAVAYGSVNCELLKDKQADLQTAIDKVPAGTSILLVLLEHSWSLGFLDSIEKDAGSLVSHDFVH